MIYGASLGSSRPLIEAVLENMTTDQSLGVKRDPSERLPYFRGDEIATFLASKPSSDALAKLLGVDNGTR